ncbi:hypothetical protein B0T14DRAFT_499001 [Immersiella caudata]|uniref:Uncharacterized protein n=1 Tax=Immersiella caudata TaxID=314043 RepID=A0AA39WDS4_9PEZI|nr:hypothetical protein B0T14DRAFT_499001 [Immersiella caudata]
MYKEWLWNKSVPVYFMRDRYHGDLVTYMMEPYIYARRFRPYRSEIDHGEHLCKLIMSPCDKDDLPPNSFDTPPSKSTVEAVTSIVHEVAADYTDETPNTISQFPVYLIRTGVEDRLSAPISFDSIPVKTQVHPDDPNLIKTTLESAVDFMMAMESRETAFLGPPPWRNPKIDFAGEEQPEGPSTKWVSVENAQKWGWAGAGRRGYDWFCSSRVPNTMARFKGEQEFRALVRAGKWHDFPDDMWRYGSAGAFGTHGMLYSMVMSESESGVEEVEARKAMKEKGWEVPVPGDYGV